MRKHERDLFYKQMAQIIPLLDEDDQRKIDFTKNFLKENFKVEDFDDSFIDFDRMGTKSVLFLLVSLLIKYQIMNQNTREQLSNFKGTIDSPNQKMKMPEMGIQKKFKSLEVDDIFLIEELTPENVLFIEQFLQKTNVDLESEANFYFIISTGQIIYLLRKIMQDYDTFLSNGKKYEE